MKDKYANFDELAKAEIRGKDYQILWRKRAAVTVVIAPHGGGIEPGTSEIAEAIAGANLSFYAFEGRNKHNKDLHIKSTNFDEPRCVALVAASECVVAIHGQGGKENVVRLGGLDEDMKQRLHDSLRRGKFPVEIIPKGGRHEGRQVDNICNRGIRGAGVQMELLKGMRQKFFKSLKTRKGRESRKPRFDDFVTAVRRVIA
jgi:phage replication-related protein YjqB (UPF0714/DUF867 family)